MSLLWGTMGPESIDMYSGKPGLVHRILFHFVATPYGHKLYEYGLPRGWEWRRSVRYGCDGRTGIVLWPITWSHVPGIIAGTFLWPDVIGIVLRAIVLAAVLAILVSLGWKS